jgi:hypothetical protein
MGGILIHGALYEEFPGGAVIYYSQHPLLMLLISLYNTLSPHMFGPMFFLLYSWTAITRTICVCFS